MKKIWSLLLCLMTISLIAEASSIEGRIINGSTNLPISGALVFLKGQKVSTVTDKDGLFTINDVKNGKDYIIVQSTNSKEEQVAITINGDDSQAKIGDIKTFNFDVLQADDEATIFAFTDNELEDDGNTQSYTSMLGSSNDVFLKTTGFRFFAARYRNRGYDQQYESGYVNGIRFNDAERGRFNYSMFGGLNDATRNKDAVNGIETTGYSYGDLSGTSNISTRASNYQQGGKVTLSASNRSYVGRLAATYATGIMNNGWAIVGSIAGRGALPHDMAGGVLSGYIQGMHYASGAAFLSAEKIINDNHSINITAFGGFTDRSQSSAATQEVYDLRGSNYYNPNWGMDNGSVRNAKVVNATDPTVIFNHIWQINDHSKLSSAISGKYSMYASTALNWNNPIDPRPDYYRNLPSYNELTVGGSNAKTYDPFTGKNKPTESDLAIAEINRQYWTSGNIDKTQVNFAFMRESNNNSILTNSKMSYMIEERHNDQLAGRLSSVYENRINKHFKINAGVEAGSTKGMHFKTVSDLLGGNEWLDIDYFALRDGLGLQKAENDLNNPNRMVQKGNIFGYNYNMYVSDVSLWTTVNMTYKHIDAFIAAKGSYTNFFREGLMRNGRAYTFDKNDAVIDSVQSYGIGKQHHFGNYAVKGGITYKINGHHFLTLNAGYETRAPYAGSAYISPRIKDTAINDLKSEKIQTTDLTYTFRTPIVSGRVTVFNTFMWDQTKFISFYHDDVRTLVNHVMTGINKRHTGAEIGLEFKLGQSFKLNAAFTYGDYVYTSNPKGSLSADNGADVSEFGVKEEEPVILSGFDYTLTKGNETQTVTIGQFKAAGTPQMAASLGLSYFHPKMWFADISVNYFDNSYLDFAPLRRTESSIEGTIKHANEALNSNPELTLNQAVDLTKEIFQQERLSSSKFWENMTVDVSLGKSIRFRNGMLLNINLSVSNIINNTQLKTGGYEQARFDRSGSYNVNKFPPKYYYAYGANYFLNIGWRF